MTIESKEWRKLEFEEKETFVHSYSGKVFLYTSNWRIANKVIKRGYEPDKVVHDRSGKVCNMEFIADITDRKKIKTLLSPSIVAPVSRKNGSKDIQTENLPSE